MDITTAEELVQRILSAIERNGLTYTDVPQFDADRERVVSDLAGLRDHDEWHHTWRGYECAPCRRHSDNLLRTATLYGVTADV